MSVLLLAEPNKVFASECMPHLLSAAKLLSDDVDVLVLSHETKPYVECLQQMPGIRSILCAEHATYEHLLAESVSDVLVKLAKDYEAIAAASSTFSKNCLPRAAALLDVECLTDVIHIENKDTFVRPIYAGNVLATLKLHASIKIMTLRHSAFTAYTGAHIAPKIITVPASERPLRVAFESQSLTKSTRPDLATAKIVISGGRGLKSAENFHLIEAIADLLGAAVGASRAAVDAGFVPNDYQVGQTGKIVAPDIYIAVGISGAIQHLAGIKDSKMIIAINNDENAPIFEACDYGLVGDLFKILPEIKEALSK